MCQALHSTARLQVRAQWKEGRQQLQTQEHMGVWECIVQWGLGGDVVVSYLNGKKIVWSSVGLSVGWFK